MEKEKPQTSNQIKDSEVHVGGNMQQAHTIYNNYIQGQTVEIPRRLTLNIPVNASHILGREDELNTIADHLAQNRPTVLVNGIGGIGKTSVASKYMATRGGDYQHLAWLTVQSNLPETFFNNTVLLDALHLHEKVKEMVEGQQSIQAFQLIMAHLDRLEKTLVVLDNANDLTDLVGYKPLFDNANCHFLITSRRRPQEWTVVGIGSLPRKEAVALFKKLAPSVEQEGVSDDAIGDLLERLFYHTLLIELVAKALTNVGFPFAEIQQMVAEKFIHDAALNEDIVSTGSHGDSAAENAKRAKIEEYIWLIFNEVKDLSDSAQQILRAFALLPLATAFEREFLKKHLEFFDIKDIVPALTLLTERGWIEKEQTPGQKPKFKMHPLIGDVVVKHLEVGVEFAAGYIGRVADLIDYDPQNPEQNLFEINKKRLLADRLSDLFSAEKIDEIAHLLDRIGYLEENFGLYQKSATFVEMALSIAEEIFEKGHKDIARYQSNLANVYNALGRYDKAAELLEEVLLNAEQFLGSEHHHVAIYQSNLAMVYGNLDQYEKAAELLETALASDLKNFGNDHPNVALKQSNLAMVYRNLGQYEKAAELLETALASDLKNFGNDHPNVAFRQNNLAIVYYNTGRNSEAKMLWQEAYQNFLKNLGPDHPHTQLLKKHSEL